MLIDGARIEGDRKTTVEANPSADEDEGGRLTPAWIVQAQLVFEFQKGESVGPVALWWIPLDEHGRATLGNEMEMGAIFPTRTEFEGGSQWGH